MGKADLSTAFRDLTTSWFRLETLQVYNVDSEREQYQEFLRTGQRSDTSDGTEWREMIARHVAAGRSLRRVHVVEEPLTDYLRFEIAAYAFNHAAGEDIGLIPVSRGEWPEGLRRKTDFWLIDDGQPSETAWAMDYDDEGHWLGVELVQDTETINTYRQWRNTALAAAVPLSDYIRCDA